MTRCSLPPDLKKETDPVSETLCSLIFLEYWTMDKVQELSNSEFLHCCVCICCHGNGFTEPLPSNDRGIHIDTQTDGRDL
jgi:hypothetical protein